MRFEFRNVADGVSSSRPNHHLADVDIVHDEPPFAGLRIVGTAIWGRKDGVPGMVVGLPSKPLDKRTATTYYHYFQNTRGSRAVQDLKDAILKTFAATYPEIAASAGLGMHPEHGAITDGRL